MDDTNADAGKKELSQKYLETQVRTATKEQLLLMLYDGAIRFCEQARARMIEKDIEGMHVRIVRAQRIIAELMGGLNEDIGAEVYDKLIALYKFIYLRLVNANLKKNTTLLDEALQVLRYLRETWQLAIDKMLEEGAKRIELAPHHLGESRGLDVCG